MSERPELERERDNATALLARFLPRAMADGVLDEVERRQLLAILTSGVLTREDVQTVFRDYLLGLHREVTSDGALTADERERCRQIVAELRIPWDFLPEELATLLART
jgi:tellurite resistance protein